MAYNYLGAHNHTVLVTHESVVLDGLHPHSQFLIVLRSQDVLLAVRGDYGKAVALADALVFLHSRAIHDVNDTLGLTVTLHTIQHDKIQSDTITDTSHATAALLPAVDDLA